MTNPNLDATMKQIDNSSFCSEAKRDAKKIFRAFAGEKEEEKTYRHGDRFEYLCDPANNAILAVVRDRHMLLVHDDGCYYGDGADVACTWRITEQEFAKICNGKSENFTRIEKP